MSANKILLKIVIHKIIKITIIIKNKKYRDPEYHTQNQIYNENVARYEFLRLIKYVYIVYKKSLVKKFKNDLKQCVSLLIYFSIF